MAVEVWGIKKNVWLWTRNKYIVTKNGVALSIVNTDWGAATRHIWSFFSFAKRGKLINACNISDRLAAPWGVTMFEWPTTFKTRWRTKWQMDKLFIDIKNYEIIIRVPAMMSNDECRPGSDRGRAHSLAKSGGARLTCGWQAPIPTTTDALWDKKYTELAVGKKIWCVWQFSTHRKN